MSDGYPITAVFVACPVCQTRNVRTNRFCEGCAVALRPDCRQCTTFAAARARFCGDCGRPTHPSPAPGSADPAIRRHTVKHVTVLSADIVGSTALIAELDIDPERAMGRLRPIVTALCDEVARFGGTVLSITGDGVFAVFAEPALGNGHARLACEAGLSMQRALAHAHRPVRIRVGLHSGAVVVDTAERDPLAQTIYGLTAHVATRLQSLAAPGSVVLSADCLTLLGGAGEARPLGARALRGLRHAVRMFELHGLRPVAVGGARSGRAADRFFGRETELAFLHERLHARSAPGAVGLAGRPGLGASRLCREFADRCRARGIPVQVLPAQRYGKSQPLQPVADFLRSGVFRLDGLRPAQARRKIARVLHRLGPAGARELGLLLDFLDLSAGRPAPPDDPVPAEWSRRLAGLFRLMLARAGRQPGVLVIEDLHWLDDASEALLESLLPSVACSALLLVLTYRSFYVAAWMREAWFEECALFDLPPSAIDGLVADRLGPARAALGPPIARRSGGNPLFAEELASLATMLPAADGNALPVTLHAAITVRANHLGRDSRALLQVASVIGQDIDAALLEAVTIMPATRIRHGLEQLCQADFLQPAGRFWAFRHAVVAEVIYGNQTPDRRSVLHAAVAATLSRQPEPGHPNHFALIAFHFEAAGRPATAARFLLRAARAAAARRPAEAAHHWRKLLFLQERDPATVPATVVDEARAALARLAGHGAADQVVAGA